MSYDRSPGACLPGKPNESIWHSFYKKQKRRKKSLFHLFLYFWRYFLKPAKRETKAEKCTYITSNLDRLEFCRRFAFAYAMWAAMRKCPLARIWWAASGDLLFWRVPSGRSQVHEIEKRFQWLSMQSQNRMFFLQYTCVPVCGRSWFDSALKLATEKQKERTEKRKQSLLSG